MLWFSPTFLRAKRVCGGLRSDCLKKILYGFPAAFGDTNWVMFFGRKFDFKTCIPTSAHRSIEQGEAMLAETVENLQWRTILDLATGRRLTFYDASYVWLAESRGLKLRTRDAEILRACPGAWAPMPEE